MLKRSPHNPVITPEMIRPSVSDHRVEGTFNAGVAIMGDQVIMLLRVAESVISADPAEILVPTLERQRDSWGVTRKAFRRDDPAYDFSDPREIKLRADPSQVFLTSMSHIRVARSTDGTNFAVDNRPFLFPETRYERFGCEDPRITRIDGRYFINYTAVSDLGIGTALATTSDFVGVERLGLIFAPDNRDVCLFPAKINDSYWALHRPAPLHFGAPEIWIARSPDLIHWGDHRILAERTGYDWESNKIGGGAQMLATSKGWLQIYHGVNASHRYSLGALLLDLADPTIVLARLAQPLAEPVESYETSGFFDNVVFTCGALIISDELHIYYGGADRVMALGTIALADLWAAMGV